MKTLQAIIPLQECARALQPKTSVQDLFCITAVQVISWCLRRCFATNLRSVNHRSQQIPPKVDGSGTFLLPLVNIADVCSFLDHRREDRTANSQFLDLDGCGWSKLCLVCHLQSQGNGI